MTLSVVYFRITHRLGRPHYVWDEYLHSVREKVEVGVIGSVTVCVVLLLNFMFVVYIMNKMYLYCIYLIVKIYIIYLFI